MDSENNTTQAEQPPFQPDDLVPGGSPDQKKAIIGIVIGGIFILAVIGLVVFFLLQESTDTARIRDIFIIFMAVESLLLGVTIIILIVQLARLINLLQNEIRPILDSTNETVSNLKGTTAFLSDNLVAPIIKLNEYLAGFTQLLQVVGLARKPSKKNTTQGE